ncbi:unnamed protein product [Phyllotreta striolata]|uniref:Uncharacterized protein n=1 Tax=Phyllotreta striolata TaxID=444603 RepID=A0A9N9TEG3_PHYSR|nr:unnamed protein product [Phyllotreta striolata]
MLIAVSLTERATAKTLFSQKLNAISTTAKPESISHQFQTDKPSYYQQYANRPFPALSQSVLLQPTQFQPPLMHDSEVPVHNQLHPQSQYQILQLIQKILHTTQQSNQPTAMIIIAQPAYLPTQSVGQNGAAQQLLDYFHSNPQARYQFLHSTPQQYYQPQAMEASQAVQSYNQPLLPSSAQYQTKMIPISVPVQIPTPNHHHQQQQQPQQQQQQIDSEWKHVDYPQYSSPRESLPPLITGFENFSPEQQEKIKGQLSALFGAPLKPLQVAQRPEYNSVFDGKFRDLNLHEFVPSQGVKKAEKMRGNGVVGIEKITSSKM